MVHAASSWLVVRVLVTRGGVPPLQALWGELGLGEILSELAAGRRFSFDAAAILKALKTPLPDAIQA